MNREFSIPETAFMLHLFEEDTGLKALNDYASAKAGVKEAALTLIGENVIPWLLGIRHQLPDNAIYVAPFAKEATGDNAIPQILADACAMVSGGQADTNIVQVTRVFHTGADPMERLSTRPAFEGEVVKGQSYVLVDDVTTMGGTLAELANYILQAGGVISGMVVIANAGRDKHFVPDKRIRRLLTKRLGDEIKEIFGIAPHALTANEANYLIGFRTADEIRNRCLKAKKEIDLRLRAKGVIKVP